MNFLLYIFQKIREVIEEEVRDPQHADAECFVLVIMTHGCAQGIYGVDGQVVEMSWITEQLNGANFPAMANKPKLVFIQACRGGRLKCGFGLSSLPYNQMVK